MDAVGRRGGRTNDARPKAEPLLRSTCDVSTKVHGREKRVSKAYYCLGRRRWGTEVRSKLQGALGPLARRPRGRMETVVNWTPSRRFSHAGHGTGAGHRHRLCRLLTGIEGRWSPHPGQVRLQNDGRIQFVVVVSLWLPTVGLPRAPRSGPPRIRGTGTELGAGNACFLHPS